MTPNGHFDTPTQEVGVEGMYMDEFSQLPSPRVTCHCGKGNLFARAEFYLISLGSPMVLDLALILIFLNLILHSNTPWLTFPAVNRMYTFPRTQRLQLLNRALLKAPEQI